MMAFFCVFVSLLMVGLVWQGHILRRYSLVPDTSEDGAKVIYDQQSTVSAVELQEAVATRVLGKSE